MAEIVGGVVYRHQSALRRCDQHQLPRGVDRNGVGRIQAFHRYHLRRMAVIGRHQHQGAGVPGGEVQGAGQCLFQLLQLADGAAGLAFMRLLVDGSGLHHQQEPPLVVARQAGQGRIGHLLERGHAGGVGVCHAAHGCRHADRAQVVVQPVEQARLWRLRRPAVFSLQAHGHRARGEQPQYPAVGVARGQFCAVGHQLETLLGGELEHRKACSLRAGSKIFATPTEQNVQRRLRQLLGD